MLSKFIPAACSAVVVLTASAAFAGEVRLRGGYTESDSSFPYSSSFGGSTIFSTGYGNGGFAEGEIILATPMPGLGIQIGGGYVRVKQSAQTNTPGGGACTVNGYLGLISDCWDATRVDSTVEKTNVDVLARFKPFSGSYAPALLLGATYLSVGNGNDSKDIYPTGVENFVHRTTHARGVGIKGGLEESVQLLPGFGITGAVFGSVINGQQSLNIQDVERGSNGGPITQIRNLSDNGSKTLYAWEARLAFYNDLNALGLPGKIEYGAKYEEVYNALVTTNTVSNFAPPGAQGSNNATFSAWSLYAGVTVPFGEK